MKKQLFVILLLMLPCLAMAETKEDREQMHHELRLGWGDQIFETLIWHDPLSVVTSMNEDYRADYNEKYRYMQHLSLEYQYRFNHWFGLGVLTDVSGVSWDVVTRNGKGVEVARDDNRHFFYNLVIMPVCRFTYYHHPYVNLYSGLGAGMCVNGGTELSPNGYKTECGMALNFTLLGLSANYDRWFGSVEFGGMYALQGTNMIFMAKSRILSVAVGCRF